MTAKLALFRLSYYAYHLHLHHRGRRRRRRRRLYYHNINFVIFFSRTRYLLFICNFLLTTRAR